MTMMTRYDPFSNMLSLRDAMDQLFEGSFVAPSGHWQPATNIMPVDLYDNGDAFVVKAFMPGLTADDLSITLEQRTATIQGQPKAATLEGWRPVLQECPTSAFVRSFTLPMAIDTDKVQAELVDGVLHLTLPKSEAVKPRKIEVKSS